MSTDDAGAVPSQDEMFESGEWYRNAWFAQNDPHWDEWNAVRLPRDARVAAVAALARLFPADFCRAALADPVKWIDVRALFGVLRWPGSVVALLELGLDALLVEPWNHRGLLERLRLAKSHADAAFEVAVQGRLVRAGVRAERVPESKIVPTPDLNAWMASRGHEIEVKRMNVPDLTGYSERLYKFLAVSDLCVADYHLTLVGSESLTIRLLDEKERADPLLRETALEFRRAVEQFRLAARPGRIPVGTLGELVAEQQPGQSSFSDAVLWDLSEEKKAARVQRIIRDGLSQLSGSCPGVIAVGVFHSAQPSLIERCVIEAAKANEDYKRCRMIVLCESFEPPPSVGTLACSYPAFHVFSPYPYRRLSKAERVLAQTIASTRAYRAIALASNASQRSTWIDTSRPISTQLLVGKVSLSAGRTASIKFKLDGSPAEIDVR